MTEHLGLRIALVCRRKITAFPRSLTHYAVFHIDTRLIIALLSFPLVSYTMSKKNTIDTFFKKERNIKRPISLLASDPDRSDGSGRPTVFGSTNAGTSESNSIDDRHHGAQPNGREHFEATMVEGQDGVHLLYDALDAAVLTVFANPPHNRPPEAWAATTNAGITESFARLGSTTGNCYPPTTNESYITPRNGSRPPPANKNYSVAANERNPVVSTDRDPPPTNGSCPIATNRSYISPSNGPDNGEMVSPTKCAQGISDAVGLHKSIVRSLVRLYLDEKQRQVCPPHVMFWYLSHLLLFLLCLNDSI